MDFYDTLKKVCYEHGTTISKLEKDLAFSNGSLSKGVPRADRLRKIAQHFDMSMDEFFGDVGNKKEASKKPFNEEDKYYQMHKIYDVALNLTDDPKLLALFERMQTDAEYKKRLLAVMDLMESGA